MTSSRFSCFQFHLLDSRPSIYELRFVRDWMLFQFHLLDSHVILNNLELIDAIAYFQFHLLDSCICMSLRILGLDSLLSIPFIGFACY